MLSDLRFGLRMFRRNPAFTAAAIIIIGFGIAATGLTLGEAGQTPRPYFVTPSNPHFIRTAGPLSDPRWRRDGRARRRRAT